MSEDKKDEEEDKEDQKEYRSVSTRDVLGNRSSKVGLLLLGLAVLCAFLSIYSDVETYHGEEVLNGEGKKKLEQRSNVINSSIRLKYTPSENSSSSVTVTVLDYENNESWEYEANGSERTYDLDPEAYWLRYNRSEGELFYHQKIVYSAHPFRILTIPAFIMTVIGIVMFYRGKYSTKKEKELEREGREEREKMQEQEEGEKGGAGPEEGGGGKPKEPRKQFMGVDWGDMDEGEEIERKDEEN